MIIIRLHGGLGNQLFQYAFGRAISYQTGRSLKIDLSSISTDTTRSYGLGCFKIKEIFASQSELVYFTAEGRAPFWRFLLKCETLFAPIKYRRVLNEKSFKYNPDVLKIRGSLLINGYWQSEKYFGEVASIIRNELTLKNSLSQPARLIELQIEACVAVSLHVRRGDYITNLNANKFHGALSMDYYEQAIKYICDRIKNPTFFIFSDDIAWVRANLITNMSFVFVDNCHISDYEEMWLMSRCSHNIIANSSFSWWGAWLGESISRIVIAPKKWFVTEVDTTDLIPNRWVLL